MRRPHALCWRWNIATGSESGILNDTFEAKAGEANAAGINAELNSFFADIERRALYMAMVATNDREEALDIVQDAMLKLAEKYVDRPASEWGPLFHRILQSRIRDWYRRRVVRQRVMVWFGGTARTEQGSGWLNDVADKDAVEPLRSLESEHFGADLIRALKKLPLRQQQVFMLRLWEGFDVKQTAAAMACGEGSVKTHYSRAIHTLRDILSQYS